MKINEYIQVLIVVIVLAFSASLIKLSIESFLLSALFIVIIFAVNIAAKKLVAYYMQASIETSIWQFQRYGIKEKQHLKYPVPAGIILPFLLSIVSFGSFVWMAGTQSDITARKSRVIKKHDFYSYSEMTEWHVGVIPAAGIVACLALAFIAYLAGFGELGKLAVLFSVFNMLPLGELDGTKIFFGSLIMWFVIAAISIIALGYTILPF